MAILRLKDLAISMRLFANNDDLRVWLTSITPKYKYVDGKATTDIEGHGYNVRLPHNGNRYISIKIKDGETPLISPIELVEKGEMLVSFEGVETKFYTNAKGYPDYSISATNIKRENV